MLNPIQRYLGYLEQVLQGKVPMQELRTVSNETFNHLEDLAVEFQETGASIEEAQTMAVERFGSASQLVQKILSKKINVPGHWGWTVGKALAAFAFMILLAEDGHGIYGSTLLEYIIVLITIFICCSFMARKWSPGWIILALVPGFLVSVRNTTLGFRATLKGQQVFGAPQYDAGYKPILDETTRQLDIKHDELAFAIDTEVGWAYFANQLPYPVENDIRGITSGREQTLIGLDPSVAKSKVAGPPTLNQFKKYVAQSVNNPSSALAFPLGPVMPFQQARAAWKSEAPLMLNELNPHYCYGYPNGAVLSHYSFWEAFQSRYLMFALCWVIVALSDLLVTLVGKRFRQSKVRRLFIV